MTAAQQTIQSDSSTAKERMGAATGTIKTKVNNLVAEIATLNADVAAFNKAVKATEGNNYVYVPRDTSLVSGSYNCVNKNQKCMKLTNTLAKSSSQGSSASASVGVGWFSASASYSQHSASSYYNQNERAHCVAVDDCTKLIHEQRMQRERLNTQIQ
jgi:hypothetical protein